MGSLLALAQCHASEAAAALVPWFCDALPSAKSRKDYYADIRAFLTAMGEQGIHPYEVTVDHVRLYKDALLEHGQKPASVSRALSVLRGTYEQFVSVRARRAWSPGHKSATSKPSSLHG